MGKSMSTRLLVDTDGLEVLGTRDSPDMRQRVMVNKVEWGKGGALERKDGHLSRWNQKVDPLLQLHKVTQFNGENPPDISGVYISKKNWELRELRAAHLLDQAGVSGKR